MKAVGIKVLKNNLSRYLDMVRKGERILVTDRDDVIAEISRPSIGRGMSRTSFEVFLEENALAGALSLPTSSAPFPRSRADLLSSTVPAGDSTSLLLDARSDRN